MRSGLSAAGLIIVVSFTGSFVEAATLMAGLALGAGLVSGLTATLMAVLEGDLSVVLTASFGADPRPSFVTFLDDATALLVPTVLSFRVSLPFVRFKDITSL
jgi:hypothetical protein